MLNLEDIQKKVGVKTKSKTLKSVPGEVTIGELTIAQQEQVNDILFAHIDLSDEKHKNLKEDDKIKIDPKNFIEAKRLTVSFGLIEPKMSLDDLKDLGTKGYALINEVYDAIKEFDSEKK